MRRDQRNEPQSESASYARVPPEAPTLQVPDPIEPPEPTMASDIPSPQKPKAVAVPLSRNPAPIFAQPEHSRQPTHEGARMQPVTEVEGAIGQQRAPIAEGEQRRRLRRGEIIDDWYLSDDDKREFGIEGAIPSCLADTDAPGDRVYLAMAAPDVYGAKDPKYIRGKRRRHPSLQEVRDKDGNYVYASSDTIWVTVSREEYLQGVARHTKRSEQFTGGLIDGEVNSPEAQGGVLENFRGGDEKFLRRKYAEAQAKLATMKMNWPPGMTLAKIEREMGVERTREIEREAARNGRTPDEGEYEAYEKRMADAAKAARKGKSFSFPGQATK